MIERPKIHFDPDCYGDRQPRAVLKELSVVKAEWHMSPEQLEQEVSQHLTALAAQYDDIPLSDNPIAGYDHIPLHGDTSVALTIYKRPYHDPEKTEFAIELSRDDMTDDPDDCPYFAAFYFKHPDEQKVCWELCHREVVPAYQDNRIFSSLLGSLEGFVQSYANDKSQQQRIFMGVGQPMVLARFGNKGYRPVTAQQETAQQMLDGSNPDFFLEYWHVKPEGHHEVICADDIDPYCFDSRKVDRDDLANLKQAGVRVLIGKDFTPELQSVDGVVAETRDRLV